MTEPPRFSGLFHIFPISRDSNLIYKTEGSVINKGRDGGG